MYKLVVLATVLACASAAPGLYGGYAAPYGYVGAPLLSAPVVKTAVPVATSYANSVRIASPALAVAHAPVVAAHGPYLAAHAPYVAAHAPYVAAPAYAHAW